MKKKKASLIQDKILYLCVTGGIYISYILKIDH